MKKRLLLVGLGRWGKILLKNLQQIPEAQLAGVVTSRGHEFSLPGDCRVFLNLPAALSEQWDGIILATPASTHVSQLESCLARGIPTLIEKPLCLDTVSANGLEKLTAETGVPVLVDHLHLFHPAYERLKVEIAGMGIDRLDSCGGNLGPFRPDASPLWDYGAHDTSLHLDLFGELPRAVNAHASSLREEAGGQAGNYEVNLHFSQSKKSTFKVGNLFTEKIRTLSVYSPAGKFEINDHPIPKLSLFTPEGHEKNISFRHISPVVNMLESFLRGLNGQLDHRWGLQLAKNVVAVLEASERACASGETETPA